MSRNTIFALLTLQIVAIAYGTGFYSVVGPGTIRSNTQYNVAVSAHKTDMPCKIEVSLTGPSLNESKIVDVPPMSTMTVAFDVPQLKDGTYNLTAEGLEGIVFKNSTALNYADNKPSTFIQTDKATYKPGDKVQFRVIFLNANTRPADIKEPISVVIQDGAQNRIKQLEDIKLTNGVYTGELQLSEQPVLGTWIIEVLIDGSESESKKFEVAKYVLPKFDVAIETAKDVAIPDGVIKVTVRSKYTYGKSVKGKATVTIEPSYHYYYDSSSDTLKAEKTLDVDGKGHVEFDLIKDLRLNSDTSYVPPLKILAVMEEELTGNKYNTTATVNLHRERYRIEGINAPSTYYPNKPVKLTVVVKHVDGKPVQDTENKAKLIVEPPKSYFYRGIRLGDDMTITTPEPEERAVELEQNLDEHGMAIFEFTLPETARSYYTMKCKFLDSDTHLGSLSKFSPKYDAPELLKINVYNEKPRLGKEVTFEVKSTEPLQYFVYTIVARGNILQSERVDVPKQRMSHIIKFTPTFEMIPKTTIYVYYVVNDDLRFSEKTINFEKEFENSIAIDAPQQTKPGEEVKLKVVTDPDSFVGLLGVDQSVLLLKSGNDFSKDAVFNSLNKYETSTPWMRGHGRYPGESSGLVTMTNANYPYSTGHFLYGPFFGGSFAYSQMGPIPLALGAPGPPMYASIRPNVISTSTRGPTSSPNQPTKIRKTFLDTWIFVNTANTSADGFTLAKQIPDTITSWVITGFSLNSKTGFALTDNPTKINVFQPFFVSTNLPYSVKRGEVIAIPVILFNYLDKTLDAEVVMDNTDKEFEFTEATNNVDDSPIDAVQRSKRVTIPSNSGKSVSFMIRPKKVGETTLKITANTVLAGDTIHQKLKVEPEGVTQFINRAVFVNLNEQPMQSEQLTVDVPAEAVPDSEYIEFSVVGDLLGPTVKNLDKLVRMPYGCGEQNMVNFVPNILVLKYLETTKREMPKIVDKAKKFLEIGYQRELTYKHDDGSYSAFGKSDKAGSTWLTAYVVRSFHQAAKFTDIDPKVIVEGLNFLANKQAENGSFPEHGKLFDSAHQNELGLTAFVLLAFIENIEHVGKYQSNLDKGMQYLTDNVDKSDDQYGLAIAAVALQLAKHPAADKVLVKLENLAKKEDDRKWWSKAEEPKKTTDAYYWRPRSNDVEITAYVLLALLDNQSAESVLPIIKWLIAQRNSNGGFSSTQDTVVGLQAIIKFAEKTGSGSGEMDIDFSAKNDDMNKGSFNVNADNALVLQTHVLPRSTRQVEFTAQGKGSAMVQLSYRYNLADKDKQPSFQVKPTVKNNTPPNQLIVDVCAEFVPLEADTKKESNMAVMEVALPSGYTADSDSFADIESVDRVKRTETKNSDSTVIIYFDSLSVGDVKCVPVTATKTHAVAKQKPAAVSLYDYYDTERRATEYYEVVSSLCDICEGEDCGSDCKKP